LGVESPISKTLQVAPNPVRDVLKIGNLDAAARYRYEIVDVRGREILKGDVIDGSIDTAGLDKGLYVLRLFGENDLMVKFAKE